MLFLSDLHIGSPMCKAEALCRFLANYQSSVIADEVYLIGDVIDDVTLKYLPASHLEAVRMLLKFESVSWFPGNHDHFMRLLLGLHTARIKIWDEGFYNSPYTGKRYLLTHGDRFDPTLLLVPPRWLRRLMPASTSGWHGRLTGDLMKKRAVADASELGCDGVICGHSHVPDHEMVGDIEFVNCGDWVKNCSAVIEDEHGLRLIGGNQ